MKPADLEPLADACRRRAAEALRRWPSLAHYAEDVLEVTIVFRRDRRVKHWAGLCSNEGTQHLPRIVVYEAGARSRASVENTIMHELAHAVDNWVRPESNHHADGIWGWLMTQFGYPHTKEDCLAIDADVLKKRKKRG